MYIVSLNYINQLKWHKAEQQYIYFRYFTALFTVQSFLSFCLKKNEIMEMIFQNSIKTLEQFAQN